MASLLKSEISRVARKQVRAETASLKKSVGVYRAEIAALKRRAQGGVAAADTLVATQRVGQHRACQTP
jgi:hypothetical protein